MCSNTIPFSINYILIVYPIIRQAIGNSGPNRKERYTANEVPGITMSIFRSITIEKKG